MMELENEWKERSTFQQNKCSFFFKKKREEIKFRIEDKEIEMNNKATTPFKKYHRWKSGGGTPPNDLDL